MGGPDAGESPPGRGWTVPEGERGLVKGLLDQPLEQPVGDQAASEVRGGAGEGGRSGASAQLDFCVGSGQSAGHCQSGPGGGLVRGRRRIHIFRTLVREQGQQTLFQSVLIVMTGKIEFHAVPHLRFLWT